MRRSLPSLALAAALFALPAGPGCLSAEPSPQGEEAAVQLETADVADTKESSAGAEADRTAAKLDSEAKQSEPMPDPAPIERPAVAAADAPAPPPQELILPGASSSKAGRASSRAKPSVLDALSSVRTPGEPGPRVVARGSTSSLNGTLATKGERYASGNRGVGIDGAMPKGMVSYQSHRSARDAKIAALRERRMAEPLPPANAGGTFVHAGTNPFVLTREDRLSTFAIDVDTASYTFARRFLERGQQPPAASVRVEEWVNAFHYSYPQPTGKHPFAIDMEAAPSPLSEGKLLVRVGIQGKNITNEERDPVHLTFLVDVSGSMRPQDRLPLAKKSLHMLVDQLRSDDSVALITYAGGTREVLRQTRVTAANKARIHSAIDSLQSGGGTAMGSGMELAYQNANKYLASGSTSRVIVLSDGDANIGRTSHHQILQSIKGYVSEGITLSTVGFGTGNYRDHLMEQLANAGNGNYSYIDSEKAARKVFVQDLTGTLQVIAQDVKIQVEMNPDVVRAYRLLGYENRDVADKDFRNDKVDAGEIGAGHSVTALYEVELVDREVSGNLGTVRVRYKKPRGVKATEVAETFTAAHAKDRFGDLDRDTRFAAALAVAAEVLRGSPFAEDLSLEDAWALAAEAADGPWAHERKELVQLLDRTVRSSSVAAR